MRRRCAALLAFVALATPAAARDTVLANDNAVTAATATGAPGRIDDETAGIPLVSPTT